MQSDKSHGDIVMTASERRLVAEGKTKSIWSLGDGRVLVQSKDDITAGDGARHDLMPGKGAWSTTTTSNVFEFLAGRGVPVAFIQRGAPRDFIAHECKMIPLEMIARGEAHGSYCERHPEHPKGTRFTNPKIEFFLKTSGRKFRGYELPCDDPLLVWTEGGAAELYVPNVPFEDTDPFLILGTDELPEEVMRFKEGCRTITRWVFLELREAWRRARMELVDFKIEFGLTHDGRLVVADVIDNDSWRLLDSSGNYVDKQLFRDGQPVEEVARHYAWVAEHSASFAKT